MKLTNYIRDAYVRAVMQDAPKVDYDETIRAMILADVLAQVPPAVASVWADSATRDYLNTTTVYVGNVGAVVPWWRHGRCEVSRAGMEKIKPIDEKRRAQNEARQSLEQKLKGAAYGCSTRKALVDLLPEFEKYLPADVPQPGRSLPVVANMMVEFTRAGWPKGDQK